MQPLQVRQLCAPILTSVCIEENIWKMIVYVRMLVVDKLVVVFVVTCSNINNYKRWLRVVVLVVTVK